MFEPRRRSGRRPRRTTLRRRPPPRWGARARRSGNGSKTRTMTTNELVVRSRRSQQRQQQQQHAAPPPTTTTAAAAARSRGDPAGGEDPAGCRLLKVGAVDANKTQTRRRMRAGAVLFFSTAVPPPQRLGRLLLHNPGVGRQVLSQRRLAVAQDRAVKEILIRLRRLRHGEWAPRSIRLRAGGVGERAASISHAARPRAPSSLRQERNASRRPCRARCHPCGSGAAPQPRGAQPSSRQEDPRTQKCGTRGTGSRTSRCGPARAARSAGGTPPA